MTDMRSQSIPEGSTTPTDDEIYDQVLGTRPCYIRGIEHGISTSTSSRSSKADIHAAYDAQLAKIQK